MIPGKSPKFWDETEGQEEGEGGAGKKEWVEEEEKGGAGADEVDASVVPTEKLIRPAEQQQLRGAISWAICDNDQLLGNSSYIFSVISVLWCQEVEALAL